MAEPCGFRSNSYRDHAALKHGIMVGEEQMAQWDARLLPRRAGG